MVVLSRVIVTVDVFSNEYVVVIETVVVLPAMAAVDVGRLGSTAVVNTPESPETVVVL